MAIKIAKNPPRENVKDMARVVKNRLNLAKRDFDWKSARKNAGSRELAKNWGSAANKLIRGNPKTLALQPAQSVPNPVDSKVATMSWMIAKIPKTSPLHNPTLMSYVFLILTIRCKLSQRIIRRRVKIIATMNIARCAGVLLRKIRRRWWR